MAKDPAILFYTSDFLTGTFTMTDEQVGRYIKLLCLQHQKGSLTMKDLKFVCQGEDVEVFAKFEQDEKGNYFNKTLKEHSEKRSAYTESRRKNLTSKPKKEPHKANHMNQHMGDHMENGNENVIVNEKEKKSGAEDFNLSFPFSSKEFLDAWGRLFDSKKWKKKSSAALQASLNKLSGHSEVDAIKMIENTIAGDWQGLFDLKPHERSHGAKTGEKSKIEKAMQDMTEAKEIIKRIHG